jgi:hypothetical protein
LKNATAFVVLWKQYTESVWTIAMARAHAQHNAFVFFHMSPLLVER